MTLRARPQEGVPCGTTWVRHTQDEPGDQGGCAAGWGDESCAFARRGQPDAKEGPRSFLHPGGDHQVRRRMGAAGPG